MEGDSRKANDVEGRRRALARLYASTSPRAEAGAGSATEAVVTDPDAARRARDAFAVRVSLPVKVGIPLALVVAVVVSFAVGKYSVNPLDFLLTVWGRLTGDGAAVSENMDRVVFNIRFPRILTAMLVGAALSAAGTAFQGLFKNPLTSPDLLGASAGASLGACIALLVGLPSVVVQLGAFAGGILAVILALWLARLVRTDKTLSLILAGILMGQLFQAGMSLVKCIADGDDKLPTITYWLMGSFASATNQDLAMCVAPILIGLALLLSQSWKLNCMSFGAEEARSLGVDVDRTRAVIIGAATLVTSASVAVAGIVGWVGLVVPHLTRALVGPNFKVLLPASMLVGATFLLVVDDLARLVAPSEVPISILTAVIGVPFFVVVYRRNMRGSS